MLRTNMDCGNNFFVQIPEENDTNSEFLNRQKSVFEKLDAVAKDSEKVVKLQTSLKREAQNERNKPSKRPRLKHDMRQFRGKESIFKRPEAPPPARFLRNLPDYRRNPEKWTKYTLSDVSQDDMSDQSNTAAAMSFLRELKAKKESELMDVDQEAKMITFKKPSTFKPNRVLDNDLGNEDKFETPSFRSSKLIMPEYVVGEKKTPKRTTTKPSDQKTIRTVKEIKLDHLEEEDDE